jgi:serine/threonine protein phosphatase PrpC
MSTSHSQPAYEFRLWGASHQGEKREANEDSWLTFPIRLDDPPNTVAHVAVVADGIGGTIGGKEASILAVEAVRRYLENHAHAESQFPNVLQSAVEYAHQQLITISQAAADLRAMGTTCTVAAVIGDRLYLAHVGDSRIYYIHRGKALQLTIDHTWAQEAVDAGVLTPEQARTHPNRHVLRRYLGIGESVEVDTRIRLTEIPARAAWIAQPLYLAPGDCILLCTDGLSDLVEDHEIAEAVQRYGAQDAVDRLIQMARQRGGHDNITVIIGALGAEPAPAKTPVPAAPAKARTFAIPIAILLAGLLLTAAVVSMLILRDMRDRRTGTMSPTPAYTSAPGILVPTVTGPARPTSAASASPQTPAAGGTGAGIPTATPVATFTPTAAPVVLPTFTPMPTPTPLLLPTETPTLATGPVPAPTTPGPAPTTPRPTAPAPTPTTPVPNKPLPTPTTPVPSPTPPSPTPPSPTPPSPTPPSPEPTTPSPSPTTPSPEPTTPAPAPTTPTPASSMS